MISYNLYSATNGEQSLTVLWEGELLSVSSSHSNFGEIRRRCEAGEPGKDFEGLFSLEKAVAEKFSRLSERVTVSGGNVYFDGDPIDNSLTKQIVRFLSEGVEDWKPLVLFLEKVALNPSENSREQLYRFLDHWDLPITKDGDFVAYKGVRSTDNGYTSISEGSAIVDGVAHKGAIPNAVGSVVEMPRSLVADNPNIACHTGLHAGTYAYARGFAQGALLRVVINPRDVVSVPNDWSSQKVRVCRYTVLEVNDVEYTGAYYADDEVDDWGFEDEYYEDEYDFDDYDTFDDDDEYDDVEPVVAPVAGGGYFHKSPQKDTRFNYRSQKRDGHGRFVSGS